MVRVADTLLIINLTRNTGDMSDAEVIAAARADALRTAEEAFNKLDVNGDGTVTKEELQGLASASTDGSGADTAAVSAKVQEFIDNFDQDGDGKVQKSEWLQFFGAMFDSVIATAMAQ